MSGWLDNSRDSMLGRSPETSVGYNRLDARWPNQPQVQVGAPPPRGGGGHGPGPMGGPRPGPGPGPGPSPRHPGPPPHHPGPHHRHPRRFGGGWGYGRYGYGYPYYYSTCPTVEEMNAILEGIRTSPIDPYRYNDLINNLIARNCLYQANQIRYELSARQNRGIPMVMVGGSYHSYHMPEVNPPGTSVGGYPSNPYPDRPIHAGVGNPHNEWPPNIQEHNAIRPTNPQPNPNPGVHVGAVQPLQTMSPFGTLRLGPGSVYPVSNRSLSASEMYANKARIFGDRYYPAAMSYQEVPVAVEVDSSGREIISR